MPGLIWSRRDFSDNDIIIREGEQDHQVDLVEDGEHLNHEAVGKILVGLDVHRSRLTGQGGAEAVAEQVEDPATAKGLVRREIVRTHTPGTVSETDLLDGSERCYLAAYGGDDEMSLAEDTMRAAFEFFTKLGVDFYCFHDRDIAPEADSLAETNQRLDQPLLFDGIDGAARLGCGNCSGPTCSGWCWPSPPASAWP